MYYIYHIPNVKLDISTRPWSCIKKLGYSEYEILEKYSFVDKAAKRLKELKKEYSIKKVAHPKLKPTYFYVYEIIDSNNKIIYVGETSNPARRWYTHLKNKKGVSYKRTDLKMLLTPNIFLSKIDAYRYQCELQVKYNLVPDNIRGAISKKINKLK